MQDTSINYWLLGDVFLRGYYSIHHNVDHTAAQIGFAPHATSTKGKVEENATLPTTNIEDVIWELTWIYDAYFFNIFGFFETNFKLASDLWVFWFGLM